MWRSTSDAKKQSPWSSAIEKGIDSLADWLIPTLGRPVDFTLLFVLLSSSSLLSVPRFGRCALLPSSGISCQTRELSQ